MIDGVEIIDFHGHQGRWDVFGMWDDGPSMIAAMDAAGIDRACIFNIFHPDERRGHEGVAGLVRAYPDRFVGFAYATPLCPDMVDEVERAITEHGFRAIKIYPLLGEIALSDRRWDPLYRFADERGLTIISHTGLQASCEPRTVVEAAQRFKNVNFVLAHAGNLPPQRVQAIRAAQEFPNVYIETCTTFRQPGVIEELVSGAGAKKVLYGSDMPLMDPRCQIGRIITAHLSDSDKRQILGENARRLLQLA